MTSTTGRADTTQHPDVSEISELTEGLLPPARTAAVRRHLDGCALCADVRTSLEEIRGLLGTLPGPARMPAEIAGRIDAALAAEALLSATAPDTAPTAVSRETPTPAEADGPTAANSSPAPTTTGDRPAGRPSAATGPGRPSGRRRRRTAVLGGLLGAAALGLGTFLFLPGTLQNAADSSGDKKSDVAASGADTRFSGEGIDQRVQELLNRDSTRQAPKDAAPESLTTEGNTPLRRTDASLPNCVRAGTDRTDPVLAFQPGDYQGSRAYLVVLPHATDSSQVQAYVLDASCAEGGTAAKADVLLTHAYPRP